MGLIGKLRSILGHQCGKREPSSRHERNTELEGKWLTVDHPYFFGHANISPDKRWVVGCDDSDGGSLGGHRMKGNGRVILVDYPSDRIVYELKCFARPVDAAVSDSGSFIVHDCGFGSALSGDVIAINTSGDEIYRRHYCANIFNIGLSQCGRYAAVQTANADNKDSNILEVLDLQKRQQMFTVRPVGTWADCYLFDTNADGELCQLRVNLRDLGYFRYSTAGEFLDAESLQIAQLDKGDYTTKIMAAQELLKTDTTEESARKALSVADTALTQGARERYDWGALAHRIRGESFESLGQLSDALEAYEQALAMNPKVGVLRRATTLRKKLSAKK